MRPNMVTQNLVVSGRVANVRTMSGRCGGRRCHIVGLRDYSVAAVNLPDRSLLDSRPADGGRKGHCPVGTVHCCISSTMLPWNT